MLRESGVMYLEGWRGGSGRGESGRRWGRWQKSGRVGREQGGGDDWGRRCGVWVEGGGGGRGGRGRAGGSWGRADG